MKNLICLIILSIYLVGCDYGIHDNKKIINIEINYAGEYYLFVCNNCNVPDGHLYIGWGENKTIWTQKKLESFLGKLGNAQIDVSKIIAPNSEDNGNLILNIIENGDILIQKIAEKEIENIQIQYIF